VTRFGADPTVKATWRFIRRWVAQNHKLYYTYVVLCAFGVYQFWWYTVVNYYRRRNHHRSLEFAIQKEKEWQAIKPKEEDEEYYGEEEAGIELAEIRRINDTLTVGERKADQAKSELVEANLRLVVSIAKNTPTVVFSSWTSFKKAISA